MKGSTKGKDSGVEMAEAMERTHSVACPNSARTLLGGTFREEIKALAGN